MESYFMLPQTTEARQEIGEQTLPLKVGPAKRSRKAWIVLAVAVIAVAALLISGIWSRVKASATLRAETAQAALPAVSVVTPKQTAPADEIILPGNVQPFITSPIYSRTNGYLKKWYFDIGAHVKQGQLLAVIETPEVDQQLQQARSNLLTAQANLELASITKTRYQGLLKSNAVAQQDVDNAVGTYNANAAIVEADKAAVEQYSALVSFEKVYAPFDGVITARNTDIGDLINSGSSSNVKTDLFHIAQPGKLRVYVNVPEEYSQGIKAGMTADLSLAEFPGRKFQGKLVRTAEAINLTTRTLLIEIDVDNPTGTLLTGSYAEVHLAVPTQASTFLLPVNALIFRSEGLRVASREKRESRALARDSRTRFRQSDRDRLRPQGGRSSHCQPTRLHRCRTGSPDCSSHIAGGCQVKRFRNIISGGNSRHSLCLGTLLAIVVLQFTACTVGPKYHPPVVQAPAAYKELGDWKPAQPNDQNLGGAWWTIFNDSQLNALEDQINVGNQNLKAAEAQFRQARAALRYNRADYYPTVTVAPSATRTRVSAHRPPATSIFDGITYNDFVLPFSVSYQADVWGRSSKKRRVVSRTSTSQCGRSGYGQSEHARGSGR